MRNKEEMQDITLLGNQKTAYPMDYAPEMLETFDNKHPGHDYFVKFNRYTTESAIQYKKQNKKKNFILFYLDSIFKFFKMYILKAGFLDGYEGYLLAKLASFYVFAKYAKLKEKNK